MVGGGGGVLASVLALGASEAIDAINALVAIDVIEEVDSRDVMDLIGANTERTMERNIDPSVPRECVDSIVEVILGEATLL